MKTAESNITGFLEQQLRDICVATQNAEALREVPNFRDEPMVEKLIDALDEATRMLSALKMIR